MLDPLESADILADLGFLLAPLVGPIGGIVAKTKGDALAQMLDGFEGDDGEGFSEALDQAALGFFSRFTKEKQRELMMAMAKVTFVVMPDGKEPALNTVFKTHFRGRLKSMYAWFLFAMKTQFSDFFTGAGGGISQSLAQVTAAMAAK